MMGWYPPLNELSDSTWHMFTHVVGTNQHSHSVHPVCPENEVRVSPIGIVDTSGGFAGLVLPLLKCLVNWDSETDRVFPGEGISFVDREIL